MVDGFELTFNFESDYPKVDDVLERIKERIFDSDPLLVISYPDWSTQLEIALECYNLATDEDDEPCNINIPESKGTREIQGPELEIPEITEKVKSKQINIETEADPKFSYIGDYWDEETVGNIVDLCEKIMTYSLPSLLK